jgi:SAM-dependent methyltransferase
MSDEAYGTLAAVYEWLVPEELLTPEGSVAAFAAVVDRLARGARVLDCAAGTGVLAVGLALRGFDVVASDASGAMVERTRALAAHHGVEVPAVRCVWDELDRQGWEGAFDAVFCVGNSLAHAAGQSGRRAALASMRGLLRQDGLLVVTSRNWERVRAEESGLRVADRVTEREGARGLVIHHWCVADAWDERHHLDVAVAVIDDAGGVTTHAERLAFWPFRHRTLAGDLRAAGLTPVSSTYQPDTERYLVVARAARRARSAG